MLVIGASLWPTIGLAVVAAFASGTPQVKAIVGLYVTYAVVLVVAYFIASLIYRANAYGNMTLLGPEQFPELWSVVVSTAEELGMKAAPRTFLFNSNGVLNAYARRLFGGRYVFLTSALVDTADDDQVRFVIGHELGHHAAGHLNPILNAVKLPANVVPFLQPAYSRAREFTCDAIGAATANNPAACRSALQMLGCGCRRLNASMSCEAFLRQEALVPPISGFIAEIFRSHPRLTRRVAAIDKQFGTR